MAAHAIGVLTTENRKIWSKMRASIAQHRTNGACLRVVDEALFIVCLDDAAPENLAELCKNFLCGSYQLTGSALISLDFSVLANSCRWGTDWDVYESVVRQAANHCMCEWRSGNQL